MKFQVGMVITMGSPVISINFPGVGVVKSCGQDINGFECVVLDHKQLKKLKLRIQKELEKGNGKESDLE